MSGRMKKNRSDRRGFLMVPVALQIFLVLSLLVALTGIGAYQVQYNGFQEYELENYHEMMELCVRTGVNQIRLESSGAVHDGRAVDLEALHERIAGAEFDPNLIERDPNLNLRWDHSEYSFRNTSLYFQYLILRGDGRVLLIDGFSGLMKELDEEDSLADHGWRAFDEGKLVRWTTAGSEGGGQQENAGVSADPEVYYLAEVVPAQAPVAYGEHTLLFNNAGAGIGMACRVDTAGIRESCRNRALRNTAVIFGISWLAIIVICLIVHRSMRPLRLMQFVMRRFRNGHEEILNEKIRRVFLPDRTKPREEMTDLSESFYVMANSLRQYRESVGSIRERYEPFIPAVLDTLFDTSDVLKILPGDEAAVNGSSLRLQFVYENEPETIQAAVIAAEIIEGKGGLVTSMDANSLTAVFPEPATPEEAIRLIGGLSPEENGFKDILWKTDTGRFRVRIIGTRERMAFAVEKDEAGRTARIDQTDETEQTARIDQTDKTDQTGQTEEA